jgi:hypothetical protein
LNFERLDAALLAQDLKTAGDRARSPFGQPRRNFGNAAPLLA